MIVLLVRGVHSTHMTVTAERDAPDCVAFGDAVSSLKQTRSLE